jgi:hypothetical protein
LWIVRMVVAFDSTLSARNQKAQLHAGPKNKGVQVWGCLGETSSHLGRADMFCSA